MILPVCSVERDPDEQRLLGELYALAVCLVAKAEPMGQFAADSGSAAC